MCAVNVHAQHTLKTISAHMIIHMHMHAHAHTHTLTHLCTHRHKHTHMHGPHPTPRVAFQKVLLGSRGNGDQTTGSR